MTATASDRILNDLKHSIREEVREEIKSQLRQELLEKLNGTAPRAAAASKPNGARPKAKTKAKGPGPKRSPEEISKTADQVLAFVTQHPAGASAEAIKGALGVELSTIELPIKKLLASKVIKKKGEKRATKYFAGKGA